MKKAPAGPPEPVAAKAAFWDMYMPAHARASDLAPVSLKSGEVAGVKNADGKGRAFWTVVFGSPSKRLARTYAPFRRRRIAEHHKGRQSGVFPNRGRDLPTRS